MKEKLEIIKQKRLEIEALKNEVNEISQTSFDEFRDYIFAKYSQLKSFGWSQYTPYFNDGDSTVFQARINYLTINEEYAEESDWFNTENVINWGQWNKKLKIHEGRVEELNTNYNSELVNANNEIVDFLENFDDDFYMKKFGDHAEVLVTPTAVDISDYDHD